MARYERTSELVKTYPPATEVVVTLQLYRASLFFFLVWCGYLGVPLLSGGRLLVPSFPTLALAPLLLLAVWQKLTVKDVTFVLKITFLLLVSIALSPGYLYLPDKFLSLIQCTMAIGIAVLIVRLMQQISSTLLERTLLLIWTLILVACVLEILEVTRELSDSFREWAYGGTYTLYRGEFRDISMVGWLRPRVFSVEPSHVTKFFVASVNAWLLLRVTFLKAAVTAAATLVMLAIMGSPMLVVSGAMSLLILLWNQRANAQVKLAMVLATLLLVVTFALYSGGDQFTLVSDRLSRVAESTNTDTERLGSEEQRVVYPYTTLIDTLKSWPVFGFGIGGKEVAIAHSRFSDMRRPEAALGNNALAEIGIYLGLVGSVCFIYLLLVQARHTGVQRLGLLALLIALFSQLMGGMDTFRYWGFIALLWGALVISDGTDKPHTPVRALTAT